MDTWWGYGMAVADAYEEEVGGYCGEASILVCMWSNTCTSWPS